MSASSVSASAADSSKFGVELPRYRESEVQKGKELGRGAFATAYKGTVHGERVCMKVWSPALLHWRRSGWRIILSLPPCPALAGNSRPLA